MFNNITRFLSGTLRVFLGFCLVMTLSLSVACKLDDDDPPDLGLNPDLIGTWTASGGSDTSAWTNTYTITANTVTFPEGFPAYADAEIVYVYNFNTDKTAGALIIKRKEEAVKEKPYNAVFFKDLSKKDKVTLGEAWDPNNEGSYDASVATLDEAKSRFGPEHYAEYGGELSAATVLSWKP